jgi:hypothetical protein
VQAALASGELDPARWNSFRRVAGEQRNRGPRRR